MFGYFGWLVSFPCLCGMLSFICGCFYLLDYFHVITAAVCYQCAESKTWQEYRLAVLASIKSRLCYSYYSYFHVIISLLVVNFLLLVCLWIVFFGLLCFLLLVCWGFDFFGLLCLLLFCYVCFEFLVWLLWLWIYVLLLLHVLGFLFCCLIKLNCFVWCFGWIVGFTRLCLLMLDTFI